jgi:tRNA G37 N-methylase TrmD
MRHVHEKIVDGLELPPGYGLYRHADVKRWKLQAEAANSRAREARADLERIRDQQTTARKELRDSLEALGIVDPPCDLEHSDVDY